MSEENKVPEPVFLQTENYISAYFGKLPEGLAGEKSASEDKKTVSNFISLLSDQSNHENKTEVLSILRRNNAQQFLVDLLTSEEYRKNRKEIAMACWECGLDFSSFLSTFVNLAIQDNYEVALECYTVITEACTLADEESKRKALENIRSVTSAGDKDSILKLIEESLGS